MRPIERIDEISELIKKIWEREPDLRYLQLIYNLQSGYSFKNEDLGKIEETTKEGFSRIGYDLFNTEDDDFLEYLKKHLNEFDN